jgi:hypothetical protein
MQRNPLSSLLQACLCVMFLGALFRALTQPAEAQGRGSGLVGKPAPEFHVDGIYNETYSLEKFKGHILVLQFGASW